MSLSLVIPFYNEENNVEDVITELIDVFDSKDFAYTIIAVNNGSKDNTFNVINKLAKHYSQITIVNINRNIGYGYGVIQGLKKATGDYVGYSVGDGQISAEDLAKVYLEGKKEDMDFCQGKREKKDISIRRFSTWVFNFIFHILFPSQVYDIGSNPKIMKKEIYIMINPKSQGWFIDSEIIIKNYLFKSKMKEVLISSYSRRKGVSKHIIPYTIIVVIVGIIKWRFKAWFKKYN